MSVITFEQKYESLIDSFKSDRRELLDLSTKVVPTPSEMHQRKWRVQQIKNANQDLKETLAACNAQLDKERLILDELDNENDRIVAQERKLEEDIKLLEGVTGMRSTVFYDQNIGVAKEITDISEKFRGDFADFYLQMDKPKDILPYDPQILKDAMVLIDTLKDYAVLKFDHRSNNAEYSKQVEKLSNEAAGLEKQLQEETIKIEQEMAVNRQSIEGEAGKEKETLQKQTRDLRMKGRNMVSELQKTQEALKKKIDADKARKRRLSNRLKSMKTQNIAVRESYIKRAKELELELDRFENRMKGIRDNPSLIDQSLINITLVYTEKTKKIDECIAQMRQEISEFNEWIRK